MCDDCEHTAWELGEKAGALAERERIIKLIEAQDKWNDHFWWRGVVDLNHNCYDCEDVRTLIDLIRKEENDSEN